MDSDGIKPAKMSKSDLYKPPTNDELVNLNETQMLYHSNLIRLQISECLKEISVLSKKREKIDTFLHLLYDFITKTPPTSKTNIDDLSSFSKICYPFDRVPFKSKGNMGFIPPVDIKVVGSYQLNMELKKHMNIDLMVVMPRDCMQAKDYMNQRYLRKRALYLTHIASHLAGLKLYHLQFAYFLQNTMKPVILVKPIDKQLLVTVRIHACPEVDSINISRFAPNKSNLRIHWFTSATGAPNEDNEMVPTPHYNSVVMADLLMEKHLHYLYSASNNFQAFKDAIKLLKVWLRQRELDQGFGCFNGFMAAMLTAYLLDSNKINKMMSSYQIIRNVFQFLVTGDWTQTGIGTSDSEKLQEFHKYYDVVFVDPTGLLNLCASMPSALYHQLKHEAALSLKSLDSKDNGFKHVFMEQVQFIRKFDQLLQISKNAVMKKVCGKLNLEEKVMDHGGNCLSCAISEVSSYLVKSLGNRISLLGIRPHKYKNWEVHAKPPTWDNVDSNICFGFLLNQEHATDPLLKGPSAESPDAKPFRQFWGDMSDLRRFKDGMICEAVVWKCQSLLDRKNLPATVSKYILKRHCDFSASSLSYFSTQAEEILEISGSGGNGVDYTVVAGDNTNTELISTYHRLCSNLRDLKDIPLSITNLQGVSPVLRCTEVYPVNKSIANSTILSVEINGEKMKMPTTDQQCPDYIAPVEIICHLEGSGKWPHEAAGIKRLKAAFHIAMAEEMKSSFNVQCMPTTSHFDVMMNGYVFRVSIAFHQEIEVLQTHITPDGLKKIRNTSQSLALEKRTVHLPHLASTLHGLQQKFRAFGSTCRIVKRWLNAQLLSRQMSEESVELICAYLFLQASPYTEPGSAQSGFLRFLSLAARFDFSANCFIVDVNNQLTDSERDEIQKYFTANREALPSICIFTPKDKTRSMWTSSGPNKVILRRLKDLATISLRAAEEKIATCEKVFDVTPMFTPSLSAYDVIIQLKPDWLPRKREAVVARKIWAPPPKEKFASSDVFPVLDFDPAQIYLGELEDSFADLAMFFHDRNGGSAIGVLWRPLAFQAKDFKVVNASCKQIRPDGKCAVNVHAVIEDFKIIGKGIIAGIKLQTENWKI